MSGAVSVSAGDLDAGETVREWLQTWLAGKRKIRESTMRSYRQHIDHYWIPLIGDHPLDRLTAEHIADVLDRIDQWNAEILTAAAEGRPPALDGDVRTNSKVVSASTQRLIVGTLKAALNTAIKQRRLLYNPAAAVELPEVEDRESTVWSPQQVAAFLAYVGSIAEPLALAFRIVLLRGLRRGEVLGLRWCDVNLETGHATIVQTVLQLAGKIVYGKPKTRSGKRELSLGPGVTALLKVWRKEQSEARLALGPAYADGDLIFAKADGTPHAPDEVTKRFNKLCVAADLPVIRLHDGRHSAATIAKEAGVPMKDISTQLGHSNTHITENLYVHTRRAIADDHAVTVENLVTLRQPQGEAETGS